MLQSAELIKAIATTNAGLAIHESEALPGKEFPGVIANPDECQPVNVSGDVDATPANFQPTLYVLRNTSAHSLQKQPVFVAFAIQLKSSQSHSRD